MQLDELLKLGAAIITGGGIAKLGDVLASRQKAKAYTMGAVDHAVETAMKSVSAQLDRTDGRLAKMEAAEAACRIELAGVKERLDGSERERAALRGQVDQLMAAPVATYPEQGAP